MVGNSVIQSNVFSELFSIDLASSLVEVVLLLSCIQS